LPVSFGRIVLHEVATLTCGHAYEITKRLWKSSSNFSFFFFLTLVFHTIIVYNSPSTLLFVIIILETDLCASGGDGKTPKNTGKKGKN